MLTSDHSPTYGDAWIENYSVIDDPTLARQRMGYCPQFDALNDSLTAHEQLYMYARLRGVPENMVPAVAESIINCMQLNQWASRTSGTYSGGNRRKLSAAVALVGNPKVVFLDEPTTGMDPKARRFLWGVISNRTREGQSVILTSHSMEECEALCSRIVIMVNGVFRCLGSPQHLKNKYGEGYSVEIRTKGTGDMDRVKEFVNTLHGSRIVEEHKNKITLSVSLTSDLTLSSIFARIEDNKNQLNILDYSVSQTTLEDVFIRFAREQGDLAI
eukprot:TRINITY_DN2067_c0_g2_i1.p1 TRINITY_DN2067_c0_g2~~TRINITY_DN2067_c0_g2_i1.p1  ORF type:complete len:272 (+),score=55.67 TRINITY_DN2067_c0_g2_i1:118-933(+)